MLTLNGHHKLTSKNLKSLYTKIMKDLRDYQMMILLKILGILVRLVVCQVHPKES